ncbi:MAG: hypothetical protein H7326_05650 [Bdellovibrionaceae bacterium]|nr:hypothetical protein [Pseudobdellovibrionaceae bacterium]
MKVREATATTMKATGCSLFVLTTLGAIAAGIGGLWASMVNNRNPLAVENEKLVPMNRNTGVKA